MHHQVSNFANWTSEVLSHFDFPLPQIGIANHATEVAAWAMTSRLVKAHGLLTPGFRRQLRCKACNQGASICNPALTCIAGKPRIVYVNYDDVTGHDVSGPYRAHFGANGQASTILVLSVNNCWKIIDDENGDFFGLLMSFCPRPWKKILTCWSTTNGLALVLDGNKNRYLRSNLKTMGKIGWTAVLMVVDMVWLMLKKISSGESGWSKTNNELFHSQFRCKVCQGGHCHGRIEGHETQTQKSRYAMIPGRWFNP